MLILLLVVVLILFGGGGFWGYGNGYGPVSFGPLGLILVVLVLLALFRGF